MQLYIYMPLNDSDACNNGGGDNVDAGDDMKESRWLDELQKKLTKCFWPPFCLKIKNGILVDSDSNRLTAFISPCI